MPPKIIAAHLLNFAVERDKYLDSLRERGEEDTSIYYVTMGLRDALLWAVDKVAGCYQFGRQYAPCEAFIFDSDHRAKFSHAERGGQ